jgi:mono/diheme cytochrome c family protein
MRTALVVASLLFSTVSFAQVDARTQRAWKAKCAACHGEDGRGQTQAGKMLGVSDMTQAAWQKQLTDDQIKTAMTKGVKTKRNGKDVEMPAVPDLKPEQLDALTKLVRGLAK